MANKIGLTFCGDKNTETLKPSSKNAYLLSTKDTM